MAHALCLQDWTTIQGGTSSTIVIQNESLYADVSGFQDIASYLEISQMTLNSATINLDIQSAPTKDDTFFSNLISGNPYVLNYNYSTVSTGVQTVKISKWAITTDVPLGRYLRWRVRFGAGGQSITFRLWLSLNQAGWL